MGVVPGFFTKILRIFLASAIMGVAVWGAARLLEDYIFGDVNFYVRVGVIGAIVVAGVIVYLIAMVATRVYSVSELKRKFLRRRS